MNGENKTNKLTAEAAHELQTLFAGKSKACSSGAKVKAAICIQPTTSKEIKQILLFAKERGFAVTSSNNYNWTVGGERTSEGGIYVCLRAFDQIGEVDPVSMSLRVGVAARWTDVVEKCESAGFCLGSRPSDLKSTVGSWIVSTAPGIGSYKYGTSKDNILNINAVTADGLIIEPGYDDIGAYMSGYNILQIFSGSEGTLGVVTEVTLKLSPLGAYKIAAYEFPDVASMGAAVNKLVHHASIKPYDISFCSASKALIVAFQGSADYIALEEAETDALVGTAAKKLPADDAAALWEKRYDYKKKGTDVVVPVTGWDAFVPSIGSSFYGSVPDRSTAQFTVDQPKEALVEKVAKCGGKVISCTAFPWTPKFASKVDEGKNLKREVTPEFIEALKDIVGAANVNTEGMERLLYSKDMAPLPKLAGIAFKNMPDVVVRPSKVEEISKIMALAYKYGVPIVPRGNSSWGLGGCMPTAGGIVLDMSSKFNNIIEMDTERMTVKVGCGSTWKELLDACMKKGFLIGSMPSSFPSGTLGAWLATNGMGIGSYKYGSAKDNVLSMEVVLGDGTVLKTGNEKIGTYKEGYNLNQFFAGSEGTLAVFATVTFRMYPLGEIRPVAYEYNKLKDANGAIQKILANPSVKPLHIAWSDELHFINQKRAGLHAPDVKNLLLVTFQGDKKFVDLEEKTVDAIVAAEGGKKIADPALAAHEWSERCYEFRARAAGVGEIPAEIIIPASKWGTFVDECYKGFEVMKMEAGGVIGVVVDRNTVLWMPYYFKDDESMLGMTAFSFNFYLGDRAATYGGRSTGFGVFFAWNMDNIHDPDTVMCMRRLKTAMDPHDVVNPGHVVCGMTRFGINMSNSLMGLGSGLLQTVKKLLPPNTTFSDNLKRFRFNTLEHRREADRTHTLGKGSE